jgi:hypothetical protein
LREGAAEESAAHWWVKHAVPSWPSKQYSCLPITLAPAPLGLFQKPNRNIDGDNRRTLGEPRDERETF